MTEARVDPATTTVRVPAKVNLELLVGPVRDDGYHSLSTVYQAVSIHDEVTVEDSDEWDVVAGGPLGDLVPLDESNLALRAARALAAHAGFDDALAVTIHKDIPVAGGMAGGSADAAAALVAVDHHWALRTPREELQAIAASLGSDIPFLLHGGTAMGSGRGELLTPVLARGQFHWVFALSSDGLSTPEVYGECDRLRGSWEAPEPGPSPEIMAALRTGDAHALAAVLANDLQEAAVSLKPDLAEVLSEGMSFGALGGIVSGSGPTVAFLCSDHAASLDLAVALTATGTVEDVRVGAGPVSGAHVVPVAKPL